MRSQIVICVALAITSASATAGTIQPVASFGANPGALKAYEYVPDGLASKAPLVVVLHGCTQTASAIQVAGWDALADQHKFAVLYAEQQTANNPVRCFNWAGEYGDQANMIRGQGENASIIEMVDAEIAAHDLDPKRVYIAGFSAGAGFTAVMLATYPDRFAAGAILSGLPYRCATDVNGAYKCQSPGVAKTAAQWGDLARSGDDGFAGPWPRVQIWQGATDTTVVPKNADELVKQWTNVHGTDEIADETEKIGAATRTAYKAGSKVVVETYLIAGMGHAVVTGTDPLGPCTATVGAYFTDKGVCSTLRAAVFFNLTSSDGGDGSGSGSGAGDDDGADAKQPGGFGCSAGDGPGWVMPLLALGLIRRRRPTIAA